MTPDNIANLISELTVKLVDKKLTIGCPMCHKPIETTPIGHNSCTHCGCEFDINLNLTITETD